MADILEYPYKAKSWVMPFNIAFFGACAIVMGYKAATNDSGLRILGLRILPEIFTFSVEGATIFHWCIAAAAALWVVFVVFLFIVRITNPMTVRLTTTEFFAPKNVFAKKPTAISLRDIKEIAIQTEQHQRFMYIYFRNGEFRIAQSMLPNPEAFEKLHAGLVVSTIAKTALGNQANFQKERQMFCPKCGKETSDGAKFCENCGANTEILTAPNHATSMASGSNPMTFGKSISTCFSKFFVFGGRASRPEYWWFYLFTVLLTWGAMLVETSEVLSTLVSLVLLFPVVAAGTRRLHDTNRSGWWQLLYFTIIGIIPVIVWMASKGNDQDNQYGSPV